MQMYADDQSHALRKKTWICGRSTIHRHIWRCSEISRQISGMFPQSYFSRKVTTLSAGLLHNANRCRSAFGDRSTAWNIIARMRQSKGALKSWYIKYINLSSTYLKIFHLCLPNWWTNNCCAPWKQCCYGFGFGSVNFGRFSQKTAVSVPFFK